MAAELFVNPKFQFFDLKGAPLANGKVFLYEPGTTTKKDTWQEAAKSNLNTNPVILDSRGEADIWFDGTYKIIVSSSEDSDPPQAPIWEVDQISRSVSDILDSNGNELLKFSEVSNAVNEVTVTDATTTNSPSIKATGDDTNIDLELDGKGTGSVKVLDDLSVTDELRLLDSDASNYVGFTSPATVASNLIFTLPDADGSANQVIETDGSGVLSFVAGNSNDRLISFDVFTASGTWTKPAGTTAALVYVTGGGGGGNAGSAIGKGGGGGAAGGTAIEYITSGLGSTETVTVGSGGAADASGTASSFGSHATGNGGAKGTTGGTSAAGGSGTGGDINIEGGDGDTIHSSEPKGGKGAMSFWGGGGSGAAGNAAGSASSCFGTGGGGGG